MRYLAGIAVFTFAHFCAAHVEEDTPAGWWHDGAAAKKVRISLDADGRGSWVAKPVYGVSWSHDRASQIVTVKFDVQPHQRARTLRLRYDPATDTLALLDTHAGAANRTFRRELRIQSPDDEEVELSTLPKAARQAIESVRPGSTRAQLEKHFEADGGLSAPPNHRYFLKHPKVGSKFVMIEVRYESVASDIVKRVSMPFLSYMAID